mmetsp:Transcript_39009/g.71703  ORF Transcript_39009/g.71703 Transcript_39009/m.71703 type:complete len:92 (-) Transcript_39009:280-555(-)
MAVVAPGVIIVFEVCVWIVAGEVGKGIAAPAAQPSHRRMPMIRRIRKSNRAIPNNITTTKLQRARCAPFEAGLWYRLPQKLYRGAAAEKLP